MAKIKVKNVDKFARSFVKIVDKRIHSSFDRVKKEKIATEIIATILSGSSPVKGKRFKPYSQKYADRQKQGRRKPVNMMVSGDMLNSLKVTQPRGKSGLLIRFKSKLAVIHDELGAGKSKVIRRLLPNLGKGEKFKSNIQKVIDRVIRTAVKKSFR